MSADYDDLLVLFLVIYMDYNSIKIGLVFDQLIDFNHNLAEVRAAELII